MAACTAHNSVVAVVQSHNKIMASSGFRYCLNLIICGLWPPHADIFPHRNVEQIVVLGNITD